MGPLGPVLILFLVSTLLRWTGAQLHTVRTEDDDDDDDDVHIFIYFKEQKLYRNIFRITLQNIEKIT